MSRGNKPCYPSAALGDDGQPHGVEPTNWPNAGEGCADPGAIWSGSNPFPTYFTVTSCNSDELRVAYHLYFKKDGFSDVIIAKGHMHDWERVCFNSISLSISLADPSIPQIIVIWRRDINSNTWTRTRLLKSYHTGYMADDWASVQNTFDEGNADEQDGKNKNHPKIYVGWAKHAMFAQRNTGFNDQFSQGCGREYRSDDWFYMPQFDTLVPGGNGTPEGNRMRVFNWGSADSGPFAVEDKICGAQAGGYTAC